MDSLLVKKQIVYYVDLETYEIYMKRIYFIIIIKKISHTKVDVFRFWFGILFVALPFQGIISIVSPQRQRT